jgi:SAM-dependent methyltransferase
MSSEREALDYPRGDIALEFCSECGFISNSAYDSKLTEYSGRYEETQGFSPTFTSFQEDLARRLVERYALYGKKIIEIGCGKGEFLTLLCDLGQNDGVGFDPAYLSDRTKNKSTDRIEFIKDFYTEKYAHHAGDFICCKMTLEHIPNPFDFVSTIRNSLGSRLNTIVFFQVPDVTRIVKNCAFEDIYYEHCSYFSPGSLARLFRTCGFDVLNLETCYEGQYTLIEAKANGKGNGVKPKLENDLEDLKCYVEGFQDKFKGVLETWTVRLKEIEEARQRVVLWGSGSKAVSFLTMLQIKDSINYVVDINPHKHGFYMPGTNQRIVPPEYLKKYMPDVVIIMNPIYLREIQEDLKNMKLTPELIGVGP